MRRLFQLGLAGLACTALAATATAQQYDPMAPEEEPVYDPALEPVEPVPEWEERDTHLLTPMGMSLSVGGGVIGFTQDGPRDFTDVGGSWEARVGVGTRTPIGFEAAYWGSAQGIDALGLDSDAILLGTGLEGALRVNFLPGLPVQPYVFGGVGWTRYDIVNEDFNLSNIEGSDNLLHIPLGGGLGYSAGRFLADVRGTFRAAFEEDMFDIAAADVDADSDRMHTWSVTARIGFEF